METPKKNFRKRTAILSYLRQAYEHPSAEMVYNHLKAEIPDLSLGTVYRNLSLFKEQGLINSLGTVGGVERFDGDIHSHVHFVCTHCGTVQDLEDTPDLPGLHAAAEHDLGSQVQGCQITFTGICRECIQNQNQEEAI